MKKYDEYDFINEEVYVQCGPFNELDGSYAIDGTFYVQKTEDGRYIIEITETVKEAMGND